MNKTNPNQTALKLINKYADRYKLIEEENSKLKREIKELSQTLTINKDIIQQFIQNSSIDSKFKYVIEQQKKEINLLTEAKENLEKENKEQYDTNNQLSCIRETLEQENSVLNNKLFILDNIIKEKNNELLLLRKKRNFN